MKDIEPVEGSIGWYQQMAPPDGQSLRERLTWRIYNRNRLEVAQESEARRQLSTDLIRGKLIHDWQASGFDTLIQITLIHTVHMEGNEHYLLSPEQANTAVYGAPKGNRIAGIIRSADVLPQDLIFAAGSLPAVSYQNAWALMERFAAKADQLFPCDSSNPTVNEDTIYQYLSALQFAFVLIHPFFEANARTSEDMLYIFWNRRPDLAHTVRYVSSDGLRGGAKINERTKIINDSCVAILRRMAQELGLQEGQQLGNLKYFTDLIGHTDSLREGDYEEIKYRGWIERFVDELIDNLDYMDHLNQFPGIIELSQNLESSSSTYVFKKDK